MSSRVLGAVAFGVALATFAVLGALSDSASAGGDIMVTVNSTANTDDGDCEGAPNSGSGNCTLREAINTVNDGDADIINFHPPVFAGSSTAGGSTVVTVNSTGNFDDGDCEGPPNDDATGNCTLAEAINMVNAGDADIIRFHPPVFSKQSPGVIDVEGGDGCLPPIEVEVVIDSSDTGVIIDGDADNDGIPIGCAAGLLVHPTSNGFDFTLNGGNNFEIRDMAGDGIRIECAGFSPGDIAVTGVVFQNVQGEDVNKQDCPPPTPTPTPILPDLTVSKTASSETVTVGEEVSFFIEVRNEGTGPALMTRVLDDLPAAFTPSDFSTSRGTCAISGSVTGGTLDCDLGELESSPGGFANIVVVGSFGLAGDFKNFAEVDPFDLITESDEGNNTSSITVSVSSPRLATPSPTSTVAPSATLVSTATPTSTITRPPPQPPTPTLTPTPTATSARQQRQTATPTVMAPPTLLMRP